MSEAEQKSSGKKWVDVVTHPLGLVGFALFLVFGLFSQPELAERHAWLAPAAVSMAAVALLAACTIALLPVMRGKKLTADGPPAVHPAPQATAQTLVRQKTQGAPAIGTVGGSFHIGDVHQQASPLDTKAHQRILELMDRKDFDIAERDRRIEELSEKYRELQTRLESGPEKTEQSHKIAELIRQGEFEKGGALLDEALEGAESDVKQAAEYHYQRGRLWELQFEPLSSLPHFESAYRYRPTSPEYAHAFAQLLQKQRRYAESDRVYSQNLWLLREGAKDNLAAYLPDVAMTLNNLALLYRATQRMELAEKAYDEALGTYRGLTKDNRAAYLPYVATTLNNLANLYSATQRVEPAEKAYDEALDIRRGLAKDNPAAHLPHVAMTLNNLAVLYSATQRMEPAEKAYDEALDIRRGLAKDNPAAQLPDVAMTLNNLAVLYSATQRMEPAEKAYDEALGTYLGLAKDNPAAYLPAVGDTLLNRAQFLFEADRLAEGDSSLSEATSLLQECSSRSPAVFGDSLARCFLLKPVLFPTLLDDSASVCDLAREAREVANDPRLQDMARRLIKEHCEPESATGGD